MATVQFSEIGNNGITRLNGAINAVTTSVIVDSVTALTLDTSTTLAYLTIIDETTWRKDPLANPETQEIVKVTSISGNTCTVVRGQGGTIAKSFSDNDIVELRIPSVIIEELQNALTDGTDDLNIGALNASGDIVSGGNKRIIAGGNTADTTMTNHYLIASANSVSGRLYLRDLSASFTTGNSAKDGTAFRSDDGVFTILGSKSDGSGSTAVCLQIDQSTIATTLGGALEVGGDLTLGASGVNTMWNEWVSAERGMWVGTSNNPSATGLKVYEANIREAHTFTCATGAISRTFGSVMLPEDYDGRAMVATLYWTTTDTDSTNVTWQFLDTAAITGDLLTASGLANGSIVVNDSAPSVISELKTTAFAFTPFSGTSGAGQMLFFSMLRNGVTDSNTGSADVIGIKFHY